MRAAPTLIRAAAIAVACVACLPDPVPLAGEHLVSGRDVSGPIAARSPAGPIVVYRRDRDGAGAIESVNAAGGAPRLLVEGAAASGRMTVDSAGVLYAALRAEYPYPSEVVRVDAAASVLLDRFPRVTRFELVRDRALVWDASPSEGKPMRLVGPGSVSRSLDAAQAVFAPSGRLYAALRTPGTGLLRFDGAAATPEVLPGTASKFWLAPDESRALVWGVDASGTRSAALLELTSPPGMRMLALGGRVLTDASVPARGDHAIVTTVSADPGKAGVTVGLVDLRDGSATTLGLIPSAWHEVMWSPDGKRAVVFLPGWEPALIETDPPRLASAGLGRQVEKGQFSPDGRWFFSFRRTSHLSFALQVSDHTFAAEPRLVSTMGGVRADEVFVLDERRVAFRAGEEEEHPELHVIGLDGLGQRRLARDVRSVLAEGPRVLAIVDENTQDRAGTLALIDVDTGAVQPLAVAVTEFSVAAACETCPRLGSGAVVTYVVRGRTATDRDGLWAARLP